MCQPANIQIVSSILHIVMLIEVTRLFKAIKIFSALLRPAARPQRGVTAVTIFIRQPRRVTLIAGYLHYTCPTCPTWPRVLVPWAWWEQCHYKLQHYMLQYITIHYRGNLSHHLGPCTVTRPGHDKRFSRWLEPGDAIISHYVV